MRDIVGYEGLYAITSCGKVWSHRSQKFLKPNDNGNGYLSVSLCDDSGRKNHYIHRLVAEAYIPNPTGLLEVNHKDKNRTHNYINNLEWCNRSYNVSYAQSKTIYCQENNKTYSSGAEAARDLGVDASAVLKCCKGKLKTVKGYHFNYLEG